MRELLDIAERHLDRTHAFFARIDTKLNGLFALASGQVAVLALNLRVSDLSIWYIDILIGVFIILIATAGARLFFCAAPTLAGGGGNSLYYFETIATRTEADFIKTFQDTSDQNRLDDVVSQIWRNSEIVSAKFRHLHKATILIVLAALPWSSALLGISLTHHSIPIIKGG